MSSALEALVYLYAAGSLIAYMLGDHRVTTDELFAAGATFTLVAWGFAYAYFVVQAWYPGSFTGALRPEEPRTWLELLFPQCHVIHCVRNAIDTCLSCYLTNFERSNEFKFDLAHLRRLRRECNDQFALGEDFVTHPIGHEQERDGHVELIGPLGVVTQLSKLGLVLGMSFHC